MDVIEDEEGDILCEELESKTHKEDDLPKVLGESKPNEDRIDMI